MSNHWHMLVLGLMMMAPSAFAERVTFDWVTVGDPGNSGDSTRGGHGGVDYVYRISKYEVTNNQFSEFLNATARAAFSGPVPGVSGIDLISGAGTLTDPHVFAVKAGFENKPVNGMGFYAALRFVNWLENGRHESSSASARTRPSTQAAARHECRVQPTFCPAKTNGSKPRFTTPKLSRITSMPPVQMTCRIARCHLAQPLRIHPTQQMFFWMTESLMATTTVLLLREIPSSQLLAISSPMLERFRSPQVRTGRSTRMETCGSGQRVVDLDTVELTGAAAGEHDWATASAARFSIRSPPMTTKVFGLPAG